MRKPISKPIFAPSFLLICLALGIAAAGCGGTHASPPMFDAKLQADLQASLNEAVASRAAPGVAIHVTAGDGNTWDGVAGVGDVGANAAMTVGDRFRAGSILKTLVAIAVLQQVERGTLALDELIARHLPGSVVARVPNGDRITVAMLLGHRSGIPEWVTNAVRQQVIADPSHVWTVDDVLTSIAGVPAAFGPGQGFLYSNTDYILLGEILTAVANRPWRETLRQEVIARAGLVATTLPEPGDLACPGCAHGYVAMAGGLVDTTAIDPSMAGACGGHALITSPADLTVLLTKLRAGALFDRAETLQTMLAFEPASDPQVPLTGYGLGVMQVESDGIRAIGHLGGTAGYQGFMLYLPSTQRYLSGYMNVMGDLGAVLRPLVARLAQP